MKIICMARGSDVKGKELAQALAAKLGYACYGREDLIEEAIKEGIAVGKLETAMLKPNLFNDRLILEKEHYVAFATAQLCRKALKENVVYHGRTGHLLLTGVSHVLRIRVTENVEDRINSAMTRLNVSRDKARNFVESVDEDIRKWVKTLYGRDWESYTHYDMVINLDQMHSPNIAAALVSIAELPEFRETPASHQALDNLRLAAEVRVALAKSERTRTGHFRVTSNIGAVQVTYRPQDLGIAEHITDVVLSVEGVREVHATMAASNILWVQEKYDPNSESCRQIIDLARGWNAAVDLMRVVPGNGDESNATMELASAAPANTALADAAKEAGYDGGIEDDVETPDVDLDDGGLEQTYNLLSREGVAGGTNLACGQTSRLTECVNAQVKYFLVVLGDLFLEKDKAARTRMTRELAGSLSESLKAPVVGVDELKKTYFAGPRQIINLGLYLLATVGIFGAVLANQVPILRFLSAQETHGKILAAVAVAVVVPIFAYLYGTFTKGVLKLLRIE